MYRVRPLLHRARGAFHRGDARRARTHPRASRCHLALVPAALCDRVRRRNRGAALGRRSLCLPQWRPLPHLCGTSGAMPALSVLARGRAQPGRLGPRGPPMRRDRWRRCGGRVAGNGRTAGAAHEALTAEYPIEQPTPSPATPIQSLVRALRRAVPRSPGGACVVHAPACWCATHRRVEKRSRAAAPWPAGWRRYRPACRSAHSSRCAMHRSCA